jgi:hypothetical protein
MQQQLPYTSVVARGCNSQDLMLSQNMGSKFQKRLPIERFAPAKISLLLQQLRLLVAHEGSVD